MSLPRLHAKAAYLTINNVAKRNALSLAVLRDLKAQLIQYNTSPVDKVPRFLPPFKPAILDRLEAISLTLQDKSSNIKRFTYTDTHQRIDISRASSSPPSRVSSSSTSTKHPTSNVLEHAPSDEDLTWLVSTSEFNRHRDGLPKALILRTTGPTFSSGHDLRELSKQTDDEIKETFTLCAQLMSLIRRSPIPIISVLGPNQLATAAGAQLALTPDMVVAHASSRIQLPGQAIGVPCSSPSAAVSRRIDPAATYRMLTLAQPVRIDRLLDPATMQGGAIEVVPEQTHTNRHPDVDADANTNSSADANEQVMSQTVDRIISQIVDKSAALPQALGKWAFWTQLGLKGHAYDRRADTTTDAWEHNLSDAGGRDGYEDAVEWTGRMMAVHARCDDAREGMAAFLEKRAPVWKT